MPEMLSESLQLTVVGLSAVFLALIVTGIMVSLIGRLFQDKPPVPANLAAPIPEESFRGIDKHVIVLLAVAATVAVKRPVRIRRVRFVSHKHVPALWAAVGRVDQKEGLRR